MLKYIKILNVGIDCTILIEVSEEQGNPLVVRALFTHNHSLYFRAKMRCGQRSVLKCKGICEKLLNCGRHYCKDHCHEGM